MDSNSSLSIFVHALTYPLTRLSALFTGLLVGLSCFILIGLFLIPGYAVRCGRHIMNGDYRLPSWDNEGDSLISNGGQALLILFIYNIATFLISFAVRIFFNWMPSVALFGPYLTISMAGCIVFIVSLPVSMMLYLSLMIFVDWDDLSRALNPSNALGLLKARPIVFLKAAVIDFVVTYILSIPFVVTGALALAYREQFLLFCSLFIVLLVLLVFQAFLFQCVRMYIWACFYRMVIGDIEVEQEAREASASAA